MRNGSVELRSLLVLALLLGLVGMHALVTTPVAGPSVSEPVTPVTVSTFGAHGAHAGHGAAASAGSSEHGDRGHGGHDAASHLLHLCLAVLAAAGMLLLVARFFLGPSAPWTSDRVPRRWPGGTPVARPPPVPRRLARLCVWRT